METRDNIIERRTEKILNWVKNPHNFKLILVLLFTVIIRLYYFILIKGQALWWDEAEYMLVAKSFSGIAPHVNYTFDPVRQVLNPFLMSLSFRIIGVNEFLPRVFLLILSIASVLGMYYLGKELYNKKVGLLASFFMSFFWLNLFFSYRIIVDIHSLTFFIFSAFFFYKYFKTGSSKALYWAAILISIGTLFKLSTAFLLPAILLYLLITEKLTFLKKKEIWIAALIFILIQIPYIVWGYIKFGGFIFTQASGVVSPDNPLMHGARMFISYLNLFPTYLSWLFVIIFILGLFSMYKLFLGLDILIKKGDKNLKRDLYLLLILLIPIIFVSVMINHAENRYIINIFPAVFIISSAFIFSVFKFIKEKNKIFAIIFIILLLGFAMNYQIKYADNMIKNKKDSFMQVKEAGLWLKENTEITDIIVSHSPPQMKHYAEREIFVFPQEKKEFESRLSSDTNLKFFVISVFENAAGWSYSYPAENNLTIVKTYYLDSSNQQPALIIYKF